MKKTSIYFCISIGLFFFASCSKDSSTSSNTGSTNPPNCNYAPYRIGSKITMVDNNGQTTNSEFTKDTTIGSIKYFYLQNKTNPTLPASYLGLDNSGNVWQYVAAQTYNGMFIPSATVLYLKPTETIGKEWNTDVNASMSGFNFLWKYVFKITEKNITKVINGTTYNNCIKVNTKVQFTISGSATQTAYEYDLIWVCGYGIYTTTSTQSGVELSKVTSFTY